MMHQTPIDILILSNGPGELTTWVRPVVQALRSKLGEDRQQVRISLVLSPCSNATGEEVTIARSYAQIDRVQGADSFFAFLLWGKTRDNWDWRSQGAVLFLGGDQFFAVLLGKRLGYKILVYAEWQARWQQWVDRFAAARPLVQTQVSPAYQDKVVVVGDLMVEASSSEGEAEQSQFERSDLATAPELIGILPGSKSIKLGMGMPLMLGIAQALHRLRPQTQFVIPVAPTLDLHTLARYADPTQNRVYSLIKGAPAQLVTPADQLPYLETAEGLRVFLWTPTPAYDLLSHCQICLTTIGANTAELTALGVPMLVLLPFQQRDVMRAWDGLPGLLANLPIVGKFWAIVILWLVIQQGLGWRTWLQIWSGKEINWQLVKQGLGLRAWPNIWAGREIVPELVGDLETEPIADLMLDYLQHPEKLEQIRTELMQVGGEQGASRKIAELVQALLEP
uniref:Putative lipid-A-disaccharide synthase n=1 Tax=Cyanothece sp. (strain PCC 7425 / ATCC 29141) TaxID=395961 RepID=B8HRZ7_CYAP4